MLRISLPGHAAAVRRRWDLTALLNAADPRSPLPERHLWLVRLLEWLRRSPPPRPNEQDGDDGSSNTARTPQPLVRLKHLLNVLDKHPEHRERVQGLLAAFWRDIDGAVLLADFGFAPRQGVLAEVGERLRLRLLPGSTDTTDLSVLFGLLFSQSTDAEWLEAIDDETLARAVALFPPAPLNAEAGTSRERTVAADAIVYLSLQVAAAGYLGALRQRMSAEALRDQPFEQIVPCAHRLREAARAGDHRAMLREAQMLRAVAQACSDAARSVRDHLEEHGISVNLLFQVDQLRGRARRIDSLLACALAPPDSPQQRREVVHLLADLVQVADERRSTRAVFARQYSMLARKVAERSAETGEHYITRDRAEWMQMLKRALGGGAVVAGTTLLKFAILATGLTAFWGGFWAGINYATSFVVIHLAHWTLATKQPAMTAPALAAKLENTADDEALEGFVDEVAHLIRSQVAGIFGNLAMVVPVVLAVQAVAQALIGSTLVSHHDAEHVLESLTLLGPTLLFAAFTGVLLFASSLIGGWAENWFVLHRLDSAIRWNPRLLARLGAPRAQRWSRWWRANISGLAANISLGMMLGIVPVVCAFFGLPIEVRHVTLSTGQIAAALGTLGTEALHDRAFWWCVAAIPLTGALNLGVSFLLAFKVALRSRGIRLADRSRIYAAVRHRLRTRFASFLWPPREAT
ncbi:site-specific recombinase [Rivibacter subsaxonicus]|uniref:Site-specific recombinase n=1 Tax=Rivibacter subsaxonicus TaxID=457575 RepID=A0A4Q7VX63_9BURK|nr:site-specific recombinase [Rivibacter subsaxonicus]RZU01263.1 site-specific recombinase [Rivibacter subsaxonicus]